MPSRPKTEVLAIDSVAPDPETIAAAAAVLRAGGLVAFPTETVYGLGANALDPAAVARIFEAKGRPARNPLIVHVTDAQAAREVVAVWTDAAARLAERFWPGPLTLVLPRGERIGDIVTGGGPTVAVRAPAHPVAQALLRACGVPLAAPSANRSTRLSPTGAEHVLKDLQGRIDLVLDGGPTSGGLESTVLDLIAQPPRLLRPGLVTPAELREVLGEVTVAGQSSDQATPRSPGMSRLHYAPRAALECAKNDGSLRVAELSASGVLVGWLVWGDPPARPPAGVIVVHMPREPAAYAARLYAALHELDEAGVQRIVVALPTDTEPWLAVRDRLRRASAGGIT